MAVCALRTKARMIRNLRALSSATLVGVVVSLRHAAVLDAMRSIVIDIRDAHLNRPIARVAELQRFVQRQNFGGLHQLEDDEGLLR